MNLEEAINNLKARFPEMQIHGKEDDGNFHLTITLDAEQFDSKVFIEGWFRAIELDQLAYSVRVEPAYLPYASETANRYGLELLPLPEKGSYRVIGKDDTLEFPALEGDEQS